MLLKQLSHARFGLWVLALGLLSTGHASAASYILPPDDVDVIGQVRTVEARHEDTLIDLAREHGLGYNEITAANPGVDTWLPGEGTEITLPTRYVLPKGPREGLVVNLSEMRLYFYPEPKAGEPPRVVTYPVSVGRVEWETPVGGTEVVSKVKNPAWYPPESIRKEHEERGDPLPRVVPPGLDNPLGGYAMRLGLPGYLIHGTNKPLSIGRRVTHGCIRMYPEDIEALFPQVPKGVTVRLVDEPYKLGWSLGRLYLEAHTPEDWGGEGGIPNLDRLLDRLETVTAVVPPERLDWVRIRRVVEEAAGLPVPVDRASTRD